MLILIISWLDKDCRDINSYYYFIIFQGSLFFVVFHQPMRGAFSPTVAQIYGLQEITRPGFPTREDIHLDPRSEKLGKII